MIKKSIACILSNLILLNSIGCFTYHEARSDERDFIEKGGLVRVTAIEDKVYYLTDVVIQDSILVGKEKVNEYQTRDINLSISDIKTIEVQKFNFALTLLPIMLIGGVVILASLNP